MFVNKLPFLVTTSRHLRFGTTEMINNQRKPTIMKAIQHVLNIYQTRNFKGTHLLMDGQFETMKDEVSSLGVTANIVARGEHVP